MTTDPLDDDPTRARLAQIRREAQVEAAQELDELIASLAHVPEHTPTRSIPQQTKPLSISFARIVFDVMEDDTILETHSTGAQADLAKARLIEEFGVTTYRIRKRRDYPEVH